MRLTAIVPRKRESIAPRTHLLARVLTLIALFALIAPTILSAVPARAQAGWSDPFSQAPSAPAAPAAFNDPNWDVLVHWRPAITGTAMQSVVAHHGTDCVGFPSTHTVTTAANSVFLCNGHLMTSLNSGEDYAATYLTPNQMVDFTAGEATINFDMSTFRSSDRDWVDVTITPYEDNLTAPLDPTLPDLSGMPRRAIQLRMEHFNNTAIFKPYLFDNYVGTVLDSDWGTGYETFLTVSAVRRDTFQLKISKTSLKFGMPMYGFNWVDTTFSDIGWSRAIVQFVHHSYNPTKDCPPSLSCAPDTWHWDNFQISNPVPFSIVKSTGTQDWHSGNATINFASAAPANSHLRVNAIGNGMEVSLDSGSTWTTLTRQGSSRNDEGHMAPYWHAIPAGTTSVQLRGSNWYGGGWRSNYAAIWSQTVGVAPTPTPQATSTPVPPSSTPTPTNTLMPTSTATATPTNTNTPTPTNTATLTPTSTNTPVPTATPPCWYAVYQNDNLSTIFPCTTPNLTAPTPTSCLYYVWRTDGLQSAWYCSTDEY